MSMKYKACSFLKWTQINFGKAWDSSFNIEALVTIYYKLFSLD
jgi:hypothetical protein